MSSVVIAGDTSGTITLNAPAVSGTTTLTLPTTSGTVLASGTAVTAAQGGTGLTSAGSNGNVLTSNGTTWVSSAPSGGVTSLNGQTGAITNTDYGAIGSYVVAGESDFTANQERLPDTTVAGSVLIRSNASSNDTNFATMNGAKTAGFSRVLSSAYTSLSLSGTWRRMTRSYNSNDGSGSALNLYVRIS